jgi:hypothetical protein
MAADPARFIIIDSMQHPLDGLPQCIAQACSDGGITWASLAVGASLSTALSYTAAGHAAQQVPMAVFLSAAQAVEFMPALWELDPDLCGVLCGTVEELNAVDTTQLAGPWLTLRLPLVKIELQSLCQRLRDDFTLHQGATRRLSEMQSLVAERTAALSDSHMHFAMQFHEAALPQALFRYQDGSCVDTNAAFAKLTSHETAEWQQGHLKLLNRSGLLPALSGPHPRSGTTVTLTLGPRAQQVTVFTQIINFGPEACLLVSAVPSLLAAPLTEPTLHIALRA